jgi:four helix bundle protein
MKTENVVQTKSFAFAVRIVNVLRLVQQDQKEFVLTKQLLRSATSIGANIEEAIGGQSEKDFLSKIGISYKESRESLYWLRLMRETKLMDSDTADSLIGEANELVRILGSIQLTIRQKMSSADL